VPIGGVVGYRRYVSPSGVGYDIACGNLAVRTTLRAADVPDAEMAHLADEIQRRISFGMGRKNAEPIDDPVFSEISASPVKQQRALVQMAAQQLGTVGSGNHYVDVLEDEAGALWVACHFGSRGFGHRTASGFMNVAARQAFDARSHDGEMDAPPLLLDATQPSGQDYVAAMHIAGQYACAGRAAVVRKVLEILGTSETFSVHNHHNFAWQEAHDAGTFWVVRKGATPAFPGQWGFVGGSMGDLSVVLRGKESEASKAALYSAVHGAGRVMSRTQAARKQKRTKTWSCTAHPCSGEVAGHNVGKGSAEPSCPICGGRMSQRTRFDVQRVGIRSRASEQDTRLLNRGPPEPRNPRTGAFRPRRRRPRTCPVNWRGSVSFTHRPARKKLRDDRSHDRRPPARERSSVRQHGFGTIARRRR
jgi:tRNA-splicing ligase RtcB